MKMFLRVSYIFLVVLLPLSFIYDSYKEHNMILLVAAIGLMLIIWPFAIYAFVSECKKSPKNKEGGKKCEK